jgi:hypothetical protein
MPPSQVQSRGTTEIQVDFEDMKAIEGLGPFSQKELREMSSRKADGLEWPHRHSTCPGALQLLPCI